MQNLYAPTIYRKPSLCTAITFADAVLLVVILFSHHIFFLQKEE